MKAVIKEYLIGIKTQIIEYGDERKSHEKYSPRWTELTHRMHELHTQLDRLRGLIKEEIDILK